MFDFFQILRINHLSCLLLMQLVLFSILQEMESQPTLNLSRLISALHWQYWYLMEVDFSC